MIFQTFKEHAAPQWQAYTQHAFVRGMADGTLPPAAFKHYLCQDYIFLLHFVRAYGLMLYKSHTPQQMRYAASTINAILDEELALHLAYCQEWGLSEENVCKMPETPATIAYTRYVLDCGHQGGLPELMTALAPCVVGYAEIAQWIMAQPFTVLEGNPYRRWIETYHDAAYQHVAANACAMLDDVVPCITPTLQKIFTTACLLEADFWGNI